MRYVSNVAAVGFIVALPLLLVTANVRFLLSDVGYYRHGLRQYHAATTTGIALPELDRAASEILAYFSDDAGALHIVVHEDGQEVSLFNARETQHMHDVKSLVRFVFRLNEVALVYVLSYVTAVFLWARERSLRSLSRHALIGVGLGAVVIGAVGVFAVAGFDSAWRQFHEIAFRNGFWELNPRTDHLIQMFPEPFWERSTLIVGLLTAAEAVAVVAVSAAYLVRSRATGAVRRGPGPRSS